MPMSSDESHVTTPRLPASLTRGAAGAAEAATEAEIGRMLRLALERDARTVVVGRGRTPAAARAAAEFIRHWESQARTVLGTVTWPEEAASWLRQARQFTRPDPDLWIMAGPPAGWAQMTRRLLWSTPWRAERTIAFASVAAGPAIGLVGAANLEGLAGATARGGTWVVQAGQLRTADTAGG
jgi:hypothetical protein